MQKWQYCFVTALHALEADERHEPQPAEILVGEGVLAVRSIKDPDKGELRRVLNGLGDEGWEVAGMSTTPYADVFYILKRPMEGRV